MGKKQKKWLVRYRT